MKRLLAFLLSAVMMFGTGISVSADADLDVPIDSEIIEEYQYTSRIIPTLSVSNKTATCKTEVTGISSKATKVEITQTLQRMAGQYWYNEATWNKTFDSWRATYITSKSSLGAGTYRLESVVKVYSGSAYETITVYSLNFKYGS